MPRSLIVLSSIAFLSAGEAATVIVDPAGGADFTDIQSAVTAAAAGDTVLVRPGEYVLASRLDFNPDDGEPSRGIVLLSEAGPRATVIRMGDGEMPSPVVPFHRGETAARVLDGFTITGGLGPDSQAARLGVPGGVPRKEHGDAGPKPGL